MHSAVADLLALLVDVAPRLARITGFIAVGVFAANVAVAFGLVRCVAGVAGRLTRPANLPDEVGTAILTTAASTTAGYATLAEYRESGLLDDRATLVAVTINTFFGFVQHVFTFYIPVLIPILGVTTGVAYVSARAGIALLITVTGVVAGGLFVSAENVDRSALADVDATGPDADERVARDRVRTAAGRSWRTLRRIVPRLAVVYTAVVWLVTTHDVAALTSVAEPVTGALGLPGAAVPVIAVYTLDTTAGAVTLAGTETGTFTVRTAVASLLIGGILSFAVSTFRRSIPFQYGIWGAAFGTKVIAVNTGLKLVFISAAVALLLASA